MLWKLNLSRLSIYYAAYCADLGQDTPVEAAVAKMFGSDSALQTVIEAIQCMGGNGVTRYYPLERMMRDAKMAQIAAGTSEVLRVVIYRQGLRRLRDDLKMLPRAIDEELGVPMPFGEPLPRKTCSGESDLLKVLAENYRVNPGLHMTMDDIKDLIDVDEENLNKYLLSLEEKDLANLYRDRRGAVSLARATYKGLAQANPQAYYRRIPEWVNEEDIF
jgi:hypothetical protein